MTYSVYAPNVHIFSFQLRDGKDDDRVWEQCRSLFEEQKIDTEFNPRSPQPGTRENLLSNNEIISFETPIDAGENDNKITGCVDALQLYDSYALALNLRVDEEDKQGKKSANVDVSIFSKLHASIESNLGSAIVLTVWLLPEQQCDRTCWREVADECVSSFFSGVETSPQFFQEGMLFDSPIFEYGNPYRDDTHSVFVWLFLGEPKDDRYAATAEDNFINCDRLFVDLFFYRQKVIVAYQQSRETYHDIAESYHKIKDTVSAIVPQLPDGETSNLQIGNAELANFQNQLKTLPKLDLDYANWLGELERDRLTIDINAGNYNTKLQQIKKEVGDDSIPFLAEFGDRICPNFQQQLVADIGYFSLRTGTIEKTIAAIRGIVEIERSRTEKELKHTIEALGLGVGAGAIVASTSGLMTQPWQRDRPFYFHPFFVGLTASFVVAIAVWQLAKRWLQKRDRV